jgi:hypothetical protein
LISFRLNRPFSSTTSQGCTVVFADPGNVEKILSQKANLPTVKLIVYTRKGNKPALPGTMTYEEIIASERGKYGSKLPEVTLTWEDNASLMFSSGGLMFG